jgi:hypothetical protein
MAEIPVGSIVASMLTESQFAQEVGDPPNFNLGTSKWTLADGKPVPGTRYAALRQNEPVPDLRGIFLRGKNHGRNDGKGNSQEANLGDFQDDQFEDHVHEINRGGTEGSHDGEYALPAYHNTGVPREPTNYIVSGKHGNETRPRNVTVNYYIRINA